MILEIVPLENSHMEKLMPILPYDSEMLKTLARAYFSEGSVAYCLLADGEPVFAGGIVNLQWKRGEAWIIPTPFFKAHVKTCYGIVKKFLPLIAVNLGFRRVQAVCSVALGESLFSHLGFEYEGTLKYFGPNGERCKMFSRIFL